MSLDVPGLYLPRPALRGTMEPPASTQFQSMASMGSCLALWYRPSDFTVKVGGHHSFEHLLQNLEYYSSQKHNSVLYQPVLGTGLSKLSFLGGLGTGK